MKQESSQTSKTLNKSQEALMLRKTISLMLRYWYICMILIFLFCGGAYLFLKYTFPTYRTQAFILVEEEDNTSGQDILSGFSMRPGVQNLENQILVLSSYNMVRKAIEELPFEIDVYKKGFRSQLSYYPLSPLRIEIGARGIPQGVEFAFQYVENEQFKLSTSSKSGIQLDTIIPFGKEFFMANGSFTIFPVLEMENAYMGGEKIYFKFYEKDKLAEIYSNRVQVENATRDGSIVRLTINGTNRIKSIIFLDKLCEVFIENNLDKKNHEAERIVEFIEQQLQGVQESLTLTETRLQNFRSQNLIMDVSAQTQQIIDQALLLENEKARLNLERSYYDYLEKYLNEVDNENRVVAPASMGIEDPSLTNLILELSGLQAEYFSSAVGERNPYQGQLDMRIRNTKESIKETLTGIRLANQLAIDENDRQINELNAKAARLPAKEQQLLGFEREFNLNNVLYNFLMERRAEAQIQKASNTPDHELVDQAKVAGLVSPIPRNIFALAISLAFVFPIIIILLFSSVLDMKISSEQDLEFITDLPVIAQFPHSRLSYYSVVLTDPSSRIAEAFRNLRTRMDFFTKDIKCPVVIVSSSIPSEGKTFVSLNLASVYSLMKVRTLMIGFDLRRPTLSKGFEITHETGMTDYLIGKKNLDEIIFETGYDNLHIIPSGPIPPNPAELSSSKKAVELFGILKEKYDIIIVDSPPVGVVSDIYPIATMADAMLMVVRHDHTKKRALQATLTDLLEYNINGVSILINDVRSSSTNYKYSYKYKYNYKSDS